MTYKSTLSANNDTDGSPRLPPTATFKPAVLAICPTKLVTVLLALEPVIATIGTFAKRAASAKISTSLRIGTPALAAATKAGSCIDTPGLKII